MGYTLLLILPLYTLTLRHGEIRGSCLKSHMLQPPELTCVITLCVLCVLSHFSHIWLFATPPGSSVHRILQARIQEWVAISSSRESSQTRDWTGVSCIGWWILYHQHHLGSPEGIYLNIIKAIYNTPITSIILSGLKKQNKTKTSL